MLCAGCYEELVRADVARSLNGVSTCLGQSCEGTCIIGNFDT